MNQPFNLKYTDIEWAEDDDGKKFKAWCEGKTGYPIVDAGMRAMNAQGCESLSLSLPLTRWLT